MTADGWKAAAEWWLEAALSRVRSDTEAVAEAEAALKCCRILAGEAEPDPDLLVSDQDEDCTCPPDLLARGGFSSGCPAHGRLRTDGCTVIYCPFCHAPLQDSTAGWWCAVDDQVFSAAEIEATP